MPPRYPALVLPGAERGADHLGCDGDDIVRRARLPDPLCLGRPPVGRQREPFEPMLATRMSPPKPILPVPATLTRPPGPVARLALIVEPVTVTLVVWSTPIAPPPAVPVAELDVIVEPEMSSWPTLT